ncbi:12635_t:CDS:2, partial [Acaulospora morrowiae]
TPSSSSQLSASPPASPLNPQKRTDQIVQNFYIKVAQIITQARLVQYDTQNIGKILPNANLSLHPRQTTSHSKRSNKWFNLELSDSDVYKDDLKLWRQISQTSTGSSAPLPMTIEFYLDTSDLTKNQVLVLTDETLRRRRIDSIILGGDRATKNIMLERWQLSLSYQPTVPQSELPVVYKKSIAFFRSLYAYVRLLPVYRLYKRIRKMRHSNALKIGYRFVLPSNNTQDNIGIDVPIIEGESRPIVSGFEFCPVDTPLGVLSLKTPGYLYPGTSPQFTSNQLINDVSPVRPLSSPKSNPDLTFPKIYAPPRSSNFGSNLSLRTPDSRRLSNTFLEPIMA